MYLISILIVLSWGLNTAVTKIGLLELPVFHILIIRFIITGLIFLPFAKLKREQVPSLLKISVSFNVAHLGFIFLGFGYLTAASASSIQQLQVPMAVALSAIFLKEKVSTIQVLGMIVAIIGVVIIYGLPDLNFLGFIFMILGALSFAVCQLFMKKSGTIDIPTFTAYTSFFCIPFLILFSILTGEKVDWDNVNYYKIALVIGYQVFILGFSTALWQRQIELYGVNKVTPFSLLNVVFAIMGGMLLLGEELNPHILLGATVTISGVALTTLFKPKE